jgi:hypothetical protein
MSIRRRILRKAEDTARRLVGPDVSDEPELKFLGSNGEPVTVTPTRIGDKEADMTDEADGSAIQGLAQQDFDRLVQEAAAAQQAIRDADYGPDGRDSLDFLFAQAYQLDSDEAEGASARAGEDDDDLSGATGLEVDNL